MKKVVFLALSLAVFISVSTLASATAQAQAFLPMTLSGPVTEYHPADCAQDGSITIAGVKFIIAAGTDTTFLDSVPVVLSSGIIGNANVRSDVFQVVGTGRGIGAYLDPQGRIRLQVLTSFPTTTRSLDITGVVSAVTANSITINNVTFPTSGPVAAVVGPNPVRISGTLNASNQLPGNATVNTTPFQKLTICTAPRSYFSTGAGLVGDANPFDGAGPITGFVSTLFNMSNFICDNSVEVFAVDGSANILVAPNFSLMRDVSKDVDACFELQIDQFGAITSGSKKISGTGNSVSGTLSRAVVQGYGKRPGDPNPPFPTSLNETQQRGSVLISGVTFIIAANHMVTIDAGVAVGGAVCLKPVIDAAGENSDFLVGWPAPRRAGQLINGSRLSVGTCP